MYDDSLDRANHPEGTWSINTRNIVITKDKKAIKNEDGFNFYAYNYPTNATPIGFITLYDDEVVIFSVTNSSEIGIIDNKGFYTTIVIADGFNFNLNYPISGRHHYNIYGHTEIVFTDNYNPVKILNITKLPFELNPDKTIKDPAQLNNAFLFPEAILPKIEVTEVGGSGGNITTGSIFFTGQYVDYNGFATNAFPLTNPTRIIPINTTYDQISGVPSGTKTSNIVKLAISNIDTRFKELKLIVVRKENSQYYAEEFTTLTIHGATTTAVYTGLEAPINKSLGSILVDRPTYTTASSVLVSDDILYLADVGAKPKLNIQKYVNNWKVRHVTERVNVNQLANSYKDGKIGFQKSTFMHNEVYALYAVITMLEGDYQYAFHIPGREVRAIQEFGGGKYLENAKVSTIAADPVMFSQEYLTEDDAISPGNVKYYQTRDTAGYNYVYTDGTLGYWENENEFYPETDDYDIWDATNAKVGTLKGKNVRHHKMPSNGRHGYLAMDKTSPVLGLEVYDIYLPDDIKEQIQNIEIYYAKRTGANSTLAGRGLWMFAAYDPDSGNITSNAGNWNTNSDKGRQALDINYVRFYPFDMLVDKTSILPNYIYNNFEMSATATRTGNPLVGDDNSSMFFKVDYTAYGGDAAHGVPFPEWRVRGIKNQRYMPFNTNIGGIGNGVNVTNRWSEETFFAALKDNTVSNRPANSGFAMNLSFPDVYFDSASVRMETYISDLCVWKPDVYNRFDEQELVSTGYRIDKNATLATGIFGGDGYIGTQGVVLTAPTKNTYADLNGHDGIRTLIKFIVETANPPELQYGEFYPKTDYGQQLNVEVSNETEYPIRFHKDYTAINSLNVVSHIDFDALDITRYFNRILRSTEAERGALVLAWREFLPNNYYDTSRDRGRIVHLEAINGEILIQHEYGLYITRGSEQLQTDVTTIEVGSGDVFARPPKEILDSKDGYVGCNSKFVCGKFKGGYFTADEKQGKVFIMDNSMKEISNSGMYQWFREHLPMYGTDTDNPFTFNGLCSSYDEEFNRIIFVKKHLVLPVQYSGNHYAGVYEDTQEFIRSLNVGDIVLKDGKYMVVTHPSPYEDIPLPPTQPENL